MGDEARGPKTGHPRVPPGQTVTKKFPVLSAAPTPLFDPSTWDFRVFGLVENALRFTHAEFMALPKATVLADFHCVTTWSRLDNRWEGVSLREIVSRARPRPEARFVIQHAEEGYTTNTPIAALLEDDVLLATAHDGRPLEPDHGGPLRMIVPKLYAWKGAKWIRALEFTDTDRPGFWEVRGYSDSADPWKEERFREKP
jgi:DMSO/TMAO reductase YedYZ molybdopterin-dependent catalytic subunit